MKFKLKSFLKKYENHISSGMLIGGFILDNLTLRGVDIFWDDIVLATYLFLAGISIIFINLYDGGKVKTPLLAKYRPWFVFLLQFVLGGAFSASFVFYARSATFGASWPFLLVILFYLLGNEFLKKHYIRFSVQLGAYFMAILSLCILAMPVIFKKIGDSIFILSGIVSLGLICLFIYILSFINEKEVIKSRRSLTYIIGGIFVAINILYFTNMIPPAPLVLRDVGLYTSVKKNIDGTYTLKGGQEKSIASFFNSTEIFNLGEGEQAYLFSSIFSPAKLNTDIVHVWYNYDENKKEWVDVGRITLPIYGGRGEGYRTYSIKEALFAGLWRVDIETKTGQIIGRKTFKIENQ